jgi:2-polyprenyl-3-methyl-5-hydroxy-6-metoxy-1,4-benzoquinol methylase
MQARPQEVHPPSVLCPVCGGDGGAELWQEGEWELRRCTDCDLVFVANPPEEEHLAALYSSEAGFHAELAGGDPAFTAEADRHAADYLRQMDEVQPPARLLDVGCATGSFMAAAESMGWKAHGVELNDDTAKIARDRGLDVTTGTLDRLPADVGGFDAVTMWDVIEHVPDPVGLLRDAHDRLTPGGWLWLATPNVDGAFPRASLKVAHRVGRWPHPEPPYHLSQFSERTIRHALGMAGFHDVMVKHRRIPLGYTFGSPKRVLTDPKRLAYTTVFAPVALVGPWIGKGDTLILAARRT